MAGQGGPDEETWKNMTPGQRRAYWVIVCLMLIAMAIAHTG
jgi:hypothetical protein